MNQRRLSTMCFLLVSSLILAGRVSGQEMNFEKDCRTIRLDPASEFTPQRMDKYKIGIDLISGSIGIEAYKVQPCVKEVIKRTLLWSDNFYKLKLVPNSLSEVLNGNQSEKGNSLVGNHLFRFEAKHEENGLRAEGVVSVEISEVDPRELDVDEPNRIKCHLSNPTQQNSVHMSFFVARKERVDQKLLQNKDEDKVTAIRKALFFGIAKIKKVNSEETASTMVYQPVVDPEKYVYPGASCL